MSDSRSLWRNRDFLKLWVGQTISQIGSRISRDGLPLTAVLNLHASPLQMGFLGGASAGAVLLFGLFAGALADRMRRRPLMMAADLGRAALLTAVPLAAMTGHLSIPLLCAVGAATAVLSVLFDIAYQAYVPGLVERDNLVEGNAKVALTESIAEVTGPGLAGVLVQWLTGPVAILFDAASFVVSAASLGAIDKREPMRPRHAEQHVLHEIAEGLRLCRDNRILRALALRTATLSLSGGFFMGLYALFAIRELRLTPAILGAVVMVGGAASLMGTLVSERLSGRFSLGQILIGSSVLSGIASFLVALAHGPVPLACLYLVAAQAGDIAWPVYSIHEVSLRQSLVPDQILGRVNSATHLLFRGLLPVGSLAGGALAEWLGVRTAMLTGASGMLLAALWLVFSPVRQLKTLPVRPFTHFS